MPTSRSEGTPTFGGQAAQRRADAGRLIRDTVLTGQEVADWLQIKRRQVQRLGIPSLDLGRKTRRYLARDVQAWLEERRQLLRQTG